MYLVHSQSKLPLSLVATIHQSWVPPELLYTTDALYLSHAFISISSALIIVCLLMLMQESSCLPRSTCLGLGAGVTAGGVLFVAIMIWWLQILVSWSHHQTLDDLPFELHQQLLNKGNNRLPRRQFFQNGSSRKSKRYPNSISLSKEDEAEVEKFFAEERDVMGISASRRPSLELLNTQQVAGMV